MEVRENLIKLCEKIGDGHYKITPDCAEYKVFEQWMTDEQIALLMAIKGAMKPNFVGGIARRAGMDKDKAVRMMGSKHTKPLVHYDYLYINHENQSK